MNTSTLSLQIIPSVDSPWVGKYFSQRTRFQYNGKQVTLAAIFELSAPDQFSEHVLENVWQEATAAAFSHRALFSEQLIEKVLKAANDGLADLNEMAGGALLLVDDSTVHFSTTGSVGVFLKEAETITRVSGDDGSTNSFAAVTSGPLEENDELIITSTQLERSLKNEDGSLRLQELMQDHQALAIWIGKPAEEVRPARQGEPPLQLITRKVLPVLLSIGSMFSRFGAGLRKLPSRLPQLKLGKFKVRTGLVVNIVLFTLLIIAIVYGGMFVKKQINKAKTPPIPTETLLTKLNATSPDQFLTFLNTSYTPEAYAALNSSDQEAFSQTLQQHTITVNKPEVVQEFPETVISADVLLTKLYAVDSTGQLWKYENNSLAKIQQNGLIINPKQLLAVRDDRLLVTDETGNIWLFDTTSAQPVSLALPKEIATGKKIIARYQNNLYIYHETDRTIYRVTNYDREITGLSTYAKLDSIAVADIVDFKVFGDAISISSTGSIQMFRKNQKLGSPIIYSVTPQPYQLFTNDTGTEITVTGGRFATVYSPAGTVLSQRFFLVDSPISAGLVQENTLRYLIANKKLLIIR